MHWHCYAYWQRRSNQAYKSSSNKKQRDTWWAAAGPLQMRHWAVRFISLGCPFFRDFGVVSIGPTWRPELTETRTWYRTEALWSKKLKYLCPSFALLLLQYNNSILRIAFACGYMMNNEHRIEVINIWQSLALHANHPCPKYQFVLFTPV